MFRTRVVEVDSVDSLERAVMDSAANRQARMKGKHGERQKRHTGRGILFLQCTFESNGAPNNVSGFTQEQKEKLRGQILNMDMFNSNSTLEELEQKKLSEIERSLYDAAREMETEGNPEPALVVEAGSCALMKCDIKGWL